MVLATGNLGKVREISQLIGDVLELIPYEGALLKRLELLMLKMLT